MITEFQKRAVGKTGSLATLQAMWDARRRWWFHHRNDDIDGEAQAAVRAAMLHSELLSQTHLPDALVHTWEREWDGWFEEKTRGWLGASRGR